MAEPNSSTPAERQVHLQRIYLKDCSLEVPLAPTVFARQWNPQLDVQIDTSLTPLGGDQFEVVLKLTVTAKLGDDVAFLAEAHQAGIFHISGFASEDEVKGVLGAYCPNVIFPFARETIADLTQRSSFPAVLLQAVNFEALYMEHLARTRAQASGETGAGNRIVLQ